MAVTAENYVKKISEYDKTISVLENMTDEELKALRAVAMVITNKKLVERPIRSLSEEEFFLKVDEGLADADAGRFVVSESFESELASEFGLKTK